MGISQVVRQRILVPRSGVRVPHPQPNRTQAFFGAILTFVIRVFFIGLILHIYTPSILRVSKTFSAIARANFVYLTDTIPPLHVIFSKSLVMITRLWSGERIWYMEAAFWDSSNRTSLCFRRMPLIWSRLLSFCS